MINYQPTPLDLAFQALGDPTRRGIVERLCRAPAPVSEVAEQFAMSLPAVMQHLRMLEASGLVRSHKKGRVRTCWIDPATLARTQDWIAEQRIHWEAWADRFGNYLEELKGKEDGNGGQS
jgi:DNA-binding transcriptional ArsR family regulator